MKSKMTEYQHHKILRYYCKTSTASSSEDRTGGTADNDDTDDEDDASKTGRLTGSLCIGNVSDKGPIRSPNRTGDGVKGSTPFKEPVMNQKQG